MTRTLCEASTPLNFFPGTDDWEYEWEDEEITEEIKIPNGSADVDVDVDDETSSGSGSGGSKLSVHSEEFVPKKSVSFATQQELRASISVDSFASQTSAAAVGTSPPIPGKTGVCLGWQLALEMNRDRFFIDTLLTWGEN